MGERSAAAFSLVELVVVMGIILLLAGFVLMVTGRVRASAQSTACLSNLRQIGQGFLIYAADHGGRMPDPLAVGLPWEAVLAPIIPGEGVFVCPADNEIQPLLGTSYDWRDTGDPATTLAGRQIQSIPRGDVVLAFESLPGWHAEGKMNVVMLGGDARTLDIKQSLGDVMTPVRAPSTGPDKGKGRGGPPPWAGGPPPWVKNDRGPPR